MDWGCGGGGVGLLVSFFPHASLLSFYIDTVLLPCLPPHVFLLSAHFTSHPSLSQFLGSSLFLLQHLPLFLPHPYSSLWILPPFLPLFCFSLHSSSFSLLLFSPFSVSLQSNPLQVSLCHSSRPPLRSIPHFRHPPTHTPIGSSQ